MISRIELGDYAKKLGFILYQAEKDYLQHAFLESLYSVSGTEFVFKGGTALQKALGLDRFSEDLDFTFNAEGEAVAFVKSAAAKARAFSETVVSKEEKKWNSENFKVKMKGPLFGGGEKSVQSITIQISLRERVLLKPVATRIVPPYADLKPYLALAMDSNEILAEKVRAIMTRHKARDLYDLWFLLKKGATADFSLIGKKLDYCKKNYSFGEFEEAVLAKQKNWLPELRILMKSVPDFGETSATVLEQFKQASRK